MAVSAFDIVASFVARTASLESGVKKVVKSLQNVEKQAAVTRASVQFLSRALGTAAIALLSKVSVQAVREQLKFAAALEKSAAIAGVTTREYQQLQFAALNLDITQGALETSLNRFSRRIGQAARNQGQLAEVTREYRIRLREQDGSIRRNIDILKDLADAVAATTDQQEKLRISAAAFGNSIGGGTGMNRLLELAGMGIKQMADEAERLGLIMDEAMIRKARDAEVQLRIIEELLIGKFRVAVVENADKIAYLGSRMQWATEKAFQLVGILQKVGDAIAIELAGGTGTPEEQLVKKLNAAEIALKAYRNEQAAAAGNLQEITDPALVAGFDQLVMGLEAADERTAELANNFLIATRNGFDLELAIRDLRAALENQLTIDITPVRALRREDFVGDFDPATLTREWQAIHSINQMIARLRTRSSRDAAGEALSEKQKQAAKLLAEKEITRLVKERRVLEDQLASKLEIFDERRGMMSRELIALYRELETVVAQIEKGEGNINVLSRQRSAILKAISEEIGKIDLSKFAYDPLPDDIEIPLDQIKAFRAEGERLRQIFALIAATRTGDERTLANIAVLTRAIADGEGNINQVLRARTRLTEQLDPGARVEELGRQIAELDALGEKTLEVSVALERDKADRELREFLRSIPFEVGQITLPFQDATANVDVTLSSQQAQRSLDQFLSGITESAARVELPELAATAEIEVMLLAEQAQNALDQFLDSIPSVPNVVALELMADDADQTLQALLDSIPDEPQNIEIRLGIQQAQDALDEIVEQAARTQVEVPLGDLEGEVRLSLSAEQAQADLDRFLASVPGALASLELPFEDQLRLFRGELAKISQIAISGKVDLRTEQARAALRQLADLVPSVADAAILSIEQQIEAVTGELNRLQAIRNIELSTKIVVDQVNAELAIQKLSQLIPGLGAQAVESLEGQFDALLANILRLSDVALSAEVSIEQEEAQRALEALFRAVPDVAELAGQGFETQLRALLQFVQELEDSANITITTNLALQKLDLENEVESLFALLPSLAADAEASLSEQITSIRRFVTELAGTAISTEVSVETEKARLALNDLITSIPELANQIGKPIDQQFRALMEHLIDLERQANFTATVTIDADTQKLVDAVQAAVETIPELADVQGKAFQEQLEAYRNFLVGQQKEATRAFLGLKSTANELTPIFEKQRVIIEAFERDFISADEKAKLMKGTFRDIQLELERMIDPKRFELISEFAERAAERMQDAFSDFFKGLDSGFDNVLRSFAQMLRDMVAELLAQDLLTSFFGMFEGSGGLLGRIYDKLTGRAKGGPLGAYQPAIVGEKGPELFVPRVAGHVVSNKELEKVKATKDFASMALQDLNTIMSATFNTERLQQLVRRANGGPLNAFQPALVGEKGPELFVPKTTGSLVQDSQINRTVVVNSAPTINFQGDRNDIPQLLQLLEENNRSLESRIFSRLRSRAT